MDLKFTFLPSEKACNLEGEDKGGKKNATIEKIRLLI